MNYFNGQSVRLYYGVFTLEGRLRETKIDTETYTCTDIGEYLLINLFYFIYQFVPVCQCHHYSISFKGAEALRLQELSLLPSFNRTGVI